MSTRTGRLALLVSFCFLLAACSSATPQPSSVATKFARLPTATSQGPPAAAPTIAATTVPSTTPTDSPLPTATAPATPSTAQTPPAPLGLRDDLAPMTLQDFPRPKDDNGEGLHFIASGYYSDEELDLQIARMQSMRLKWALVLYADENMLEHAALKFKAAGIMVVWRKAIRPYQHYFGWGRDIDLLKSLDVPPYFQIYNEPELDQEWDGKPRDLNLYMTNMLQAARDVYNGGGYVGVQVLSESLLGKFIDQVNARQGQALFRRMFFIPHAYGVNHPPDYTKDYVSVLSFKPFSTFFQERLGFVPPFIVGEGGWTVGNQDDTHFPKIDEALHRDYTLGVFNWFRTGKLSDGSPLPDYLFAFCHWIISGKLEAGAWFDAFNGDRTLTIQAVQQLPSFTRKFTWGK